MSFAASLTKIVADKQKEQTDRSKISTKWTNFEAKLLDQAADLFKSKCVKEAEQQKSEVTVSFEVLTREIPDFPKRILTDSAYFVDTWGEDVTAESWFYACKGTSSTYSPGLPIMFAEVLEGMMPKFLERLKAFGFQTCNREAGTWKVTATWSMPEKDEPAPKRSRHGRENGHS
mmetsp:Transcript_159743/g.297810  ORF Transcript_159743/g.297810 Transcript_159743/m.297810 type:complete len:174 (-) Transcript_159743:112-633(-)